MDYMDLDVHLPRKAVKINHSLTYSSTARYHMGQVTELLLSCYLVLLSIDRKTR